jgi:hypothetical protein
MEQVEAGSKMPTEIRLGQGLKGKIDKDHQQ